MIILKVLKRLIHVSLGRKNADLVLKNCNVFNSFTGEFIEGDIAITSGYIAGVGKYSGKKEINLDNAYVTPGFIDGHVHIESSMVSPLEFAKAVVPLGTLTAIIDPHEIANVLGEEGIKYILNSTKDLPMNIYVMLPSCVPATSLETSGSRLTAENLKKFIDHPRVLGLGELMDYEGVLETSEEILKKIEIAKNKIVDGHAPGLKGKKINAYASAGIKSDHECINVEEAKDRLLCGMYLMIREGSVAKNLKDLLPVVNENTVHRCFFVTDDRNPEDIIELGSINHMIKIAVDYGIDISKALQMATINAANYFRLDKLGAIAPGYIADILVFEDFKEFKPKIVFKDGKLVAKNGKIISKIKTKTEKIGNTMKVKEPKESKLKVPAKSEKAYVIGLVPGQLITKKLKMKLPIKDGYFRPSPSKDVVKLAVFERHKYTGNVGVGFLHGLGLKKGAIASTVAHDSHNIVVAGVKDEDILLAVKELIRMSGGIVVVEEGKVKGSLPLPIAGLMSDKKIHNVYSKLKKLKKLCLELGIHHYNPFMVLSFMSLPVIPEIRLTDKGLVDVNTSSIISVSVKE